MDVVVYALLKGAVKELSTKVDGLAQGFDYKGSVATPENLPASPTAGDAYTVSSTGGLYAYDGTTWIRINQDLVDKMDDYMSNLADDYSTTESGYEVDDYCLHGNKFYRCISPVAVNESWNAAKWEQTTVSHEIQNPPGIPAITNQQIDDLF